MGATKDHKPDDPEEKARIEAARGEVRSQVYPDGWTSHRVFVKGMNFPGLAMSRTLGDRAVKNCGVTHEPDVTELKLKFEDKPFIILGSDGLWEFITAEFAAKGVARKLASDGQDETIRRLAKEAKKRWKHEEGSYCDDITIVFVRLT